MYVTYLTQYTKTHRMNENKIFLFSDVSGCETSSSPKIVYVIKRKKKEMEVGWV